MERSVIIVNGWKSSTIITKYSILDVAAALDPPLERTKQQMSWKMNERSEKSLETSKATSSNI